MNDPNEHPDYQVVVHEVTAGPLLFRWEVFSADRMDPVDVSPDHFDSMEAAYEAGQVWLADFLRRQAGEKVGTRHSGETLVPSLAAAVNGQGDVTGRGWGSASEPLIGTALPVYPPSIG